MPEAVETETPSLVGGGGSRVVGLVAAVVAPTTLISALAYYFGYRRERAFAGFFGIDVSALNFTTMLVAFGAVFVHALAIPDDNDVRIQLTRGADYAPSRESTAKGQLAFTC